MKKNAFTMLELTLVIVVMGILAALAIPRMERDVRNEAEQNIISALRYTQNLALTDNKTNPLDSDWQKELWSLRFASTGGKWYYTISSDANQEGGVDKNETAIDPVNGKLFFNQQGTYVIDPDETPAIFLSRNYGVNSIVTGGSCGNGQHIAFDQLGRPHAGLWTAGTHNNYSSYLQTDCTITVGFTDNDINDLIITVAAETGFITTN